MRPISVHFVLNLTHCCGQTIWLRLAPFLLLCAWLPQSALSQTYAPPTPAAAPLVQLGPGDEIRYEVYGQSDMNGNLHVADDGTISVPLAGTIQVAKLSPLEAAQRVQKALSDGYLVNPHVTIALVQSRGQRISVLGEVHNPGRFAVDSSTTILDLLAQAGGVTDNAADEGFILRPNTNGQILRTPIDVRNLNSEHSSALQTLQPGDSVYVPRAEQFYIYGEVTSPNKYRIETGMTVIQAIARAGGITLRGSTRRVEVKRKNPDGTYKTFSAKPSDLIQTDDVLRVKESLF